MHRLHSEILKSNKSNHPNRGSQSSPSTQGQQNPNSVHLSHFLDSPSWSNLSRPSLILRLWPVAQFSSAPGTNSHLEGTPLHPQYTCH